MECPGREQQSAFSPRRVLGDPGGQVDGQPRRNCPCAGNILGQKSPFVEHEAESRSVYGTKTTQSADSTQREQILKMRRKTDERDRNGTEKINKSG